MRDRDLAAEHPDERRGGGAPLQPCERASRLVVLLEPAKERVQLRGRIRIPVLAELLGGVVQRAPVAALTSEVVAFPAAVLAVPDRAGSVALGADRSAVSPRGWAPPATTLPARVPPALRRSPAGQALRPAVGQRRDLPAPVAVRASCGWLGYAAGTCRPDLSRPVAATVLAADRAPRLLELPTAEAQVRPAVARPGVDGPPLAALAAPSHRSRVSPAIRHRAWRRGCVRVWG